MAVENSRYYVPGAGERHVPRADCGLHLVSTPIGNLGDITLRALDTLAGADVIFCEDTRITRRLLDHYGIDRPVQSYHEHNAEKRRPEILKKLAQGGALALVSDAGTPVISDPGYKLITVCLNAGYALHALPGASAPIMALTLSGLPSDRFLFAGFAPVKAGPRRKFLTQLKLPGMVVILFESARRLETLLGDIEQIWGDCRIALAREMTKKFEEVMRGEISEMRKSLASRPPLKGEITLVIDIPALVAAPPDQAELDDAIETALAVMPASRAASELAQRFGLKKKQLYDRIVKLQDRNR